MGLIKCSECGKKFSDNALSCPECSCPTSVVMNYQEKSYYIERLKEKANSLNNLDNYEEKEKILCECVCLLSKIKNEKDKINFDNSLDGVRNLLKKVDNIDENYLTEFGISNYEEIIDFISKRLLISELIDIQEKRNKELSKSRKLSDDVIKKSVESEVEYYYKNRQNSKNGVFYKIFTDKEKELNSRTYLYSLLEKGLVVGYATSFNDNIFIYDKELMEDCKIVNDIDCFMEINQYFLWYSLYCFLKEKKELSFKEIADFIENELKYILPEAENKEIKSYINILFILIKYYYKNEENDKVFIYEENEKNEEEFLYWSEEYERYFKFISKYLSENNVLKASLEEYNKLAIEYEIELDGLSYERMQIICRILTCNDILKSDETNFIFKNNMQLITNLKESIKSIISEKENISLNNLEKEIYQKMKFKSHLNFYLSELICECIAKLESDKFLITYKKNGETSISIFSEKIEIEKELKEQEEKERLQAEKEEMNNFFTAPEILCKEIKLFTLLLSKKELYLGYFKNNDEYDELSELFDDLAYNYNEYARAVLNMPLQQYKPMSSSTAGTLGTIAGGLSAGILASERAEKKMAEYNASQKKYFSSKISMDREKEKAEKNYYMIEKIIYKNIETRNDWIKTRDESIRNSKSSTKVNGGCYVATCVYGSYDCPQVWTLRRFRDNYLDKHLLGKCFIKMYYIISPTLVKIFGKNKVFILFNRAILDKLVKKLKSKGYNDIKYYDKL